MRSFFKRPSWANTGDGSSPSEFYRRADQTYGDIVAASREARVQSINQEDEQASTNQHITDENRGDMVFSTLSEDKQVPSRQCNELIQRARSPDKLDVNDACRSASNPGDQNVTSELLSNAVNPIQGQLPSCSPCATDTPARTPQIASPDNPLAIPTSNNGKCGDADWFPNPEPYPSDPRQDLTARILISSEIASTKSLVIKRKLHQPLKDVRLAWCEHQGLPRELYPFVFLTWKGRRLFDVTTCKSLGTHLNKGLRSSAFCDDVLDDCAGIDIHMIAVMDDRVPSHLSALLKTLSGQHSETPTTPGVKMCRPMRLVFKCPGRADYDVYSGLQTRVSQLIEDYRVAHNVGTERNVYLTFDGDCLDPNSCPADYDMAHEDLVDVIIK